MLNRIIYLGPYIETKYKKTTFKKKGADRTDCKCNFCIHQQCIPETRWEPAEYYCDEDSDNYGTDWGCWLFEDAEDAADAAVADF